MKSQRLVAAAALAVLLVAPASAQMSSYKDLKFAPLREPDFAPPQVFQLKNGLTVFLVEDHELPLIQANVLVRTGSLWEPAEKTGLASLVGAVQRTGGTARMTGDQIDDFLAARAATVETSIGRDSGSASMNCLKQNFDEVFPILVDVLRTPAFAQDKLDLAKVQANTAISRRNDSAMGILMREFPRLVYGKDSPLGRIEEYATIASVTRDDLLDWHRRYYVPNRVYLGLVGDFDSKEMRKKVEAALGDWKKGPAMELPPVEYAGNAEPGLYFVEKGDVNQAYVSMGHLGIERKNRDYYAVTVMNEVLGGSFASRMFSNVRSKKGLAYNVFGSLGADFVMPGLLRAGLQTKSSTMAQGVEAVKAEIEGIVARPPDDDELRRAKDAILNSFVFNFDSRTKILNQQMLNRYHGLPDDYLARYRENIQKVSRDEVARVAKAYVRPDRLAILVVGKAADFDRPLSSLGKVTPVDIAIPPPPDRAPKVEKSAAAVDAGRKSLARVVAALGGENASSVRAIRTVGKMTLAGPGGQGMTLGRDSTVVFPDRIRQVLATPMGEQVAVLNRTEGFVSGGGQVRPLPADRVETERRKITRDLRFLIRASADPKLDAVAAGSEEIDGTRCDVVSVAYDGVESRLWIAPDGRVLKQAYQGEHPVTRAPAAIEITFSDYRPAESGQVPFKQVVRADGQEAMTIILDSFTANPPVDDSLFEKPKTP